MKQILIPVFGLILLIFATMSSPYHSFVMMFVVPCIVSILTFGAFLYSLNAYETEKNMIIRERLYILNKLEEYSEVKEDE